MQAPATRPHFLLLWIGVLLLCMTAALKLLVPDPASHDGRPEAHPPLAPPMVVPVARDLPLLLDASGQPLVPPGAEGGVADSSLEHPSLLPGQDDAGRFTPAARELAGVELPGTEQGGAAPKAPTEVDRIVPARGDPRSSGDHPSLRRFAEPDGDWGGSSHAIPPPFAVSFQGGSLLLAGAPIASGAGAASAEDMVLVVPLSPEACLSFLLRAQDSAALEAAADGGAVAEGDQEPAQTAGSDAVAGEASAIGALRQAFQAAQALQLRARASGISLAEQRALAERVLALAGEHYAVVAMRELTPAQLRELLLRLEARAARP